MAKHITDRQYYFYISLRGTGMTQEKAALKTDISVRSARRLEKAGSAPSSTKKDRHWRTRKNPFASVWDQEIVPKLEASIHVTARTILDHLQEDEPGKYPDQLLRTLQRHVKNWRALHGKEKEVFFYQEHPPGHRGLSDFTQLKEVQITISGQPFDHLLYHFRLAFSGWRWVKVVQGGESFSALSSGLQEALWKLGACPQEHRTDSLSAAFKNLSKQATQDFTKRYAHLMDHYGLTATRNNPGKSHENGSIEASHGHLKRRILQELELRGSCDFESVPAYEKFLQKIVGIFNGRQNARMKQERPHLNPLPKKKTDDFEEVLVRVTRASTIQIRRGVYTVDPRLIGQKIKAKLFHDRIEGFLGKTFLFTYPRLFVPARERRYHANYRHVIHSLVKKPHSFANALMRDALLPTKVYEEIWHLLKQVCSLPRACRLMVGLLKIAADTHEETAIGQAALHSLEKGLLPCLGKLLSQYGAPSTEPIKPLAYEEEIPPSLVSYDALLHDHQEVPHV